MHYGQRFWFGNTFVAEHWTSLGLNSPIYRFYRKVSLTMWETYVLVVLFLLVMGKQTVFLYDNLLDAIKPLLSHMHGNESEDLQSMTVRIFFNTSLYS